MSSSRSCRKDPRSLRVVWRLRVGPGWEGREEAILRSWIWPLGLWGEYGGGAGVVGGLGGAAGLRTDAARLPREGEQGCLEAVSSSHAEQWGPGRRGNTIKLGMVGLQGSIQWVGPWGGVRVRTPELPHHGRQEVAQKRDTVRLQRKGEHSEVLPVPGQSPGGSGG